MEKTVEDTQSISFFDDPDDLGGIIFFNRKAHSEFTDLMNHIEEDEFDAHIDDLIQKHRYAELARYPFIFFRKPADFDPKKYSVEPLGQERAEWSAANDQAMTQTAVSRAKRHFHLMWLCVRPEEVKKLQNEILLSTEDLGKLRGIGDPWWVEECREYTVSTIRQVARMKRKYTAAEILAANAFRDEVDRGLAKDSTSGDLCALDDL
jgi:hypothetical protein